MPVHTGRAVWEGSIGQGKGTMTVGTGIVTGAYSHASRFEAVPGSSPEELLAAAHAGCFSMALSSGLTRAGHPPAHIATTARVQLTKPDAGWRITRIDLETEVDAPGIDQAALQKYAGDAKVNCPISQALAPSIEVTLQAKLVG
jgi:lipoyl-dependent peroxiredoxin